MAKRRRKSRTHVKAPTNSAASATSGPKSFVIRAGKVGRSASALVTDIRRVLEPNTASRLRERRSNKLRDFVSMAGPLGVSHLLLLSQPDKGTSRANLNLRVARSPKGPTCTFRVNKFALARDVASALKRPHSPGGEFTTPPLLVMNNFSSQEQHIQLLVSMFQGLFPPINVQRMALSSARRIVLLSYDDATGTIDWRHYLITVRPVGVSKKVRRVIEGTSSKSTGGIKGGKIPDLSNAQDISSYLLGRGERAGSSGASSGFETDASSAAGSDSEAEDSEVEEGAMASNHVELPARYVGRGNLEGQKRAVRLKELGPRIELKCIKIQEGIPGAERKGAPQGNVLWHDYVKKSAQEKRAAAKSNAEKQSLRAARRAEQEANVERKKKEKEGRSLSGRRGARGAEDGEDESDEKADGASGSNSEQEEHDDEFAYEDAHAPADQDLFDEEEDFDVDEDDQVDEEEQLELDGDDDEEDDSDLSPIEITGDYSDESDEVEEEEEEERRPSAPFKARVSKASKAKRPRT
ncbi:Brix-domain-containing protein [Ceraceosorus guamensis]|uniref:Brix-domain-containing protein n=1 Tax=Ceraceosorus guamensis TaxID=1522189 RepID=A0A316VSG3_9BASI|nr:Brix-domain-containing protein [Ceraceosorus guamensis]PWN40537.1 Brix-domain-containing protein [Ceraceosorus guamensis]